MKINNTDHWEDFEQKIPFQSVVQWRIKSANPKLNGILLLSTTWKNSA